MTIDWTKIRTFNKSQNNAFEELVCQLAREESHASQFKFDRVAAPDGGVEAYATDNNGDECGWQAKYFFSMHTSQWSQLSESFLRALSTHPKLTKYYVCIPLDRQDPRRPNELWFMDRWNEHSSKWVAAAAAVGRNIQIEYWGSSELVHRLSKEQNAGRRLFWFSEIEFSDAWFKNHVENSVENLGERYTSLLNVNLNISRNFDSLSRNAKFKDRIASEFNLLSNCIERAIDKIQDSKNLKGQTKILKESVTLLSEELSKVGMFDLALINIPSIQSSLDSVTRAIDLCRRKLKDAQLFFDEIIEVISESKRILNSSALKLSNRPILAIVGDAGIGKSHLLADTALNLINHKRPCIFLLGQHFRTDEAPWTQILKNLLRLNCGEHDLLGALNARAEASGERLIFFIDAINEGRGAYFWPDHIQGFIKDFSQYPWLGLAVSLRTSYERLILPDQVTEKANLVKVRHRGFAGKTGLAAEAFFAHYKIDPPSVPFFNSEYENPLFLKLLCEGLKKTHKTAIPAGHAGISSIIEFFLDGVEKNLCRPSSYNYPEGLKLAKRVINRLIEYKTENNIGYLSYQKAFSVTKTLTDLIPNGGTYLDALISEGAISKNLYWLDDGSCEEGIYFSYERFEDHLAGNYLLQKYFSQSKSPKAKDLRFGLGEYIETHQVRQGILEALSIQFPERNGLELFQVLNESHKGLDSINEAFIYSLAWRPRDTITRTTIRYLNEHVLQEPRGFDLFFQMLYTVAGDPDHEFNGERLHEYFMQYSLAVRDSFWVPYLHYQDEEDSTLARLIAWAEDHKNHVNLPNYSRVLICKSIAWLLASTNISLRNSATRALTSLFRDHVNTAIEVLKCFEDVNDPYILERLLAAAYGAVLNSSKEEHIDQLSHYLYRNFFDQPEVFPHALARDYARNIVEYAFYRKLVDIDIGVVRPPYKSTFPKRLPENTEINRYIYDYKAPEFQPHYWSQNAIIDSMTTEYGRGVGRYGDFGRYTFQSAMRDWDDFDVQELSNWAVQIIFEKLGYDVELHGQFDRSSSKGDRSHNIAERIGKKYQWIAFFEVIARVGDNYMMKDSTAPRDSQGKIWYEGPWYPFIRNFDPTVIKDSIQKSVSSAPAWWHDNVSYDAWEDHQEKWLTNSDDLPDARRLISRIDDNSDDWLVLETYRSWDAPLAPTEDRNLQPHEQLWYQIRSYFVHEKDANDVIQWTKTKHLMGRWFPEGHDQYQIFAREYFWSPAYHFLNRPYFGRTEWEELREDRYRGKIIGAVMPTTEGHRWETRNEDGNAYLAPCETLFRGLNLLPSNKIGEWRDTDGTILSFDPSVHADASSELFVRRLDLTKFLNANKLKVFWTILGEKRIFGGLTQKTYERWLEVSGVVELAENGLDISLIPKIVSSK